MEYNTSTGDFKLAASGEVPQGSWAFFENDYGAVAGNRYNQIPRNRKASLHFAGWKGCRLKRVTLSMCSNNKSGQIGLSVSDGDATLYNMHPVNFSDEAWFGQWVSKDLNVYVDVTKTLSVDALSSDEGCITLQGGTDEGSVYINAITIQYDEAPGMTLVSPLGWTYEKLGKKSTLNEGDKVMLYRNGCAAADFGGMEDSHYLDVVPLSSTTDIDSPYVLCFTLNKADGKDKWTLTDQNGRALGATGKQMLAWDEGSTLWTVSLGYDGAELSNESYGSLRYNDPQESYARFNIYTSTSLPLPFLYRKGKQIEPQLATSLTFTGSEVNACISDGYLVLRPVVAPSNITDRRIRWNSSHEDVATVNGGYVSLKGVGQTVITASTADGGATASILLTVSAETGIDTVVTSRHLSVRKVFDGRQVRIVSPHRIYGLDGMTHPSTSR